MTRMLQPKPSGPSRSAAVLLLVACFGASSCLESLPPDLDPQQLSVVAAPPGSSFEGLYQWAARTVTVTALPDRRYRLHVRASDGSLTEWTARFVALDPQTSGLALPPGGQAYVAVLTDRVPKAGLYGAVYYVLLYDGRSDGYVWRDIEVREENRGKVEAALAPTGLWLVSSPRLRLVKRGGGEITANELRALPVGALPLSSDERLDRVRSTTAAAPSRAPVDPLVGGAYGSAPFLTPKGFMQELREVRLVVNVKAEAVQVPESAWRSVVEHHLNRRGITVSEHASVTATVSMTHLRLSLTGPANEILVQLDFGLKTAVQRGGPFTIMNVSPASTFRWYVWVGDGPSLASTLRDQFASTIDQMLDVVSSDDPAEKGADRSSSRWSAAAAAPLNAQFENALKLRLSRPGNRTLMGLRSFPEIRVELGAEAGQFLNEQAVREVWRNELRAAGLQGTDGPPWMIRHSIVAAVQNIARRTIHHCLDVREVFQRDVVYPLNGRLVRSDIRITWSHTLAFCSQGQERTKLEGLVTEHARALANDWRSAQVR